MRNLNKSERKMKKLTPNFNALKPNNFFSIFCIFGAISVCSFANSANAQGLEQISVRGGTLGLGGEIGIEIVPTVVLRGIVNKYDYDYKKNVDGISYEGTLGLGSYGAQIDLHPPLVPLYLTGGIYKNDNNINMNAVPQGTFNIGGTNYTGAQIGTLNSVVKFGETALYGGAGLEFAIGPIAAVLEAGVYYQGEPDVSMRASGPIASDPAFANNLNNEIAAQKDQFDKLKYWPAITLMARYKF